MKNLGNMLQQVQELQGKMEEMQAQLAEMEVTGSSGGGTVQVTLNGKGEARGVKIDPSIFSPDDTSMLEDLMVAAFNDARTKVDEMSREKMSEVTGGLPLPPGMQLPF